MSSLYETLNDDIKQEGLGDGQVFECKDCERMFPNKYRYGARGLVLLGTAPGVGSEGLGGRWVAQGAAGVCLAFLLPTPIGSAEHLDAVSCWIAFSLPWLPQAAVFPCPISSCARALCAL